MTKSGKSPYGKYGFYGSPSYNFKPIGCEGAGDYSKTQMPKIESAVKVRRLRSPAKFVAAILCALLLLTALMSQSALLTISEETYLLRLEIDDLLEKQRELKIEHAMTFSFADTEEYALEVLGMHKPSAEQICYLELSDTGAQQVDEIKNNEAWNPLSLLREYFPG